MTTTVVVSLSSTGQLSTKERRSRRGVGVGGKRKFLNESFYYHLIASDGHSLNIPTCCRRQEEEEKGVGGVRLILSMESSGATLTIRDRS